MIINPTLASLTPFERGTFAEVLELAAQEMSNNGCNDFPVKVTDENLFDVLALIHKVAADKDDLKSLMQDAKPGATVYLTDWMLLSLLKDLLLKG